jgi:hypothetical protein
MNLPTGIELVSIDVTQYIKDTFYLVDLRPQRHGSFIFELKDSESPTTSDNFINYYGSGICDDGQISGLNIEFYHDLNYRSGGELKETKCVYEIKEIENLILCYL